MNLNSLSTSTIANSVWTAAARTLTNPSGVWSDATRQLSSFFNLITDVHNVASVVSTLTRLDLRPAANKIGYRSAFFPVTANVNFANWDGTTSTNYTLPAAETFLNVWGTATSGLSVNNQSGGAVTVTYSGFDIA